MVLSLLFFLPLLTLLARAAASFDAAWKRIGAVVVAAAALLGPLLGQGTAPNPYVEGLGFLAIVACGLYLLLWSVLSRDPAWVRIVSVLAALGGLLPVAVAWLAMANYHE